MAGGDCGNEMSSDLELFGWGRVSSLGIGNGCAGI
jgi:hypothetical protein